MRFGIRSNSVENVADVSSKLVTTRRVIFTPNTDIKQELANTSISITCYDRNGNLVKQVTSSDDGEVEDDENNSSSTGTSSGSTDSGSSSTTSGTTDTTGGSSEGGSENPDGNYD